MNCTYKGVFVFITVLVGIYVSLLEETGGGLLLRLALSVGAFESMGIKKGINRDRRRKEDEFINVTVAQCGLHQQ